MITNNIYEINIKYNNLINNYNKFFFNNIIIYKDNNSSLNIYIKGLNLIENIFNIGFLYLDNLGDIYNLCEKSFVYFIEFINQINISNNMENSIELTIKDAVLFCYKKTILEFNDTINNTKENIDNLNIINKYNNITNIINTIYTCQFHNYLVNNNELDNKNNSKNDVLNQNIINNSKKINTLLKKIINNNIIVKSLDNILEFVNVILKLLLNNKNNYNNIILLLEKFIIKELYLDDNNINLIDEINNNLNNINYLLKLI